MSGLKLVTDAAAEPISLDEAKAFLKLDALDATEDGLLQVMIRAARKHCEEFTGLCFISQTWDAWIDRFSPVGASRRAWVDGVVEAPISEYQYGRGAVSLGKFPVLGVTSITVFSMSDVSSAYDVSKVVVDEAARPGRIFLKAGETWPTDVRSVNGAQIRFTAGFGATAASVPQDIVQACYLVLGHLYEHRGSEEASGIPATAQALLRSHAQVRL